MKKKSEIQIFLAHASEDKPAVVELYERLKAAGYKPWLDKKNLIPGQNWRSAISQAIAASQLFIACLSQSSIIKQGFVQREFKMALNQYADRPPNSIYLIPLRLDQCEIPNLRQEEYGVNLRDLHWLDYWEEDGFEQLQRAIRHQFGPFAETLKNERVITHSERVISYTKQLNQTLESKIELVDNSGNALIGAKLVAIADNNTIIQASSDSNGIARLSFKQKRKYDLLIAHTNFRATVLTDYIPGSNLKVTVPNSKNISSVICPQGTGYLEGLKGRLTPILDNLYRAYLYADNIAINGGKQQPVYFDCNEPMELEDCDGVTMQVTVMFIKGRTSLLEYVKPEHQLLFDLSSERGIDYTKLRDLLAAGKWKEADQETAKVMCQASGREEENRLDSKDIDNFPCKDLRTINQLWLHYSNGKFGFSVQREIYEDLGGAREYNNVIWDQFLNRVGWRKGGQLVRDYSDLSFDLERAPLAHFPILELHYLQIYWREGKSQYKTMGGKVNCHTVLFSRVKDCNL